MGHRNTQFNNRMIEMQADQGHHNIHLNPEPCIAYSNLPNYPHWNINFLPLPEQHHENPLLNPMPQHNLDLNVSPPTVHYNNNPYLTLPAGVREFPVQLNHAYSDSMMGPSKRKNFEGPSSNPQFQNAQVGPSSSETDVVENGPTRSVRNRARVVGPDQGYAMPPVQLPGNPWWGQPTSNFPYVHVQEVKKLPSGNGTRSEETTFWEWVNCRKTLRSFDIGTFEANASRACLESGNTGVQGYPVALHMQRLGGYNVGQPWQITTPSHGIPTVRYSNTNTGLFRDAVEAGPTFLAQVPCTGFHIYGPHQGEIMLDPNMRNRGFPQLRVLPEDELLALGEQIGSVGNGLSEEFIKYNLKTRSYTLGPSCINLEVVPCPDQEKVNFCVVCQMDYECGENIGVLDCGHEYHRDCIKKWLVVKNSCPVCKSTALCGKGKVLAIDEH
ncbi:RING/U-box superfamily protein [Striga asiatica]|uniref:RING-type E3 ubiquitin transferase n=1 Tax=Striga asiatica TaxID=4170 RepID=A0A5A7QDA7_STRAF|nr:RING/U-box superfamily protein [Striga asiatica]